MDTPAYEAERQEAIAEHREWRQEQTSAALLARLDMWTAQTTRLSKGISQDPDYLAGFGRGVEAGRNTVPTACDEVLAVFRREGFAAAAVIGEFLGGPPRLALGG